MERRSPKATGGIRAATPEVAPGGKIILGWREHIDFPEWHLRGIIAKLDTGARSGAIDVSEIEELPGDRVRFAIRLKRRSGEASKHLEAPISRRTRVRSAFGHARDRLFIMTTVQIGPVIRRVELGLVCRRKMLCRVLLGRMVLDSDFLVDSGRRYVLGRRRRSSGVCPLQAGDGSDKETK